MNWTHHCGITIHILKLFTTSWNWRLVLKPVTSIGVSELKHSLSLFALFPLTHSFALQRAAFVIIGILESQNQLLPLCCQWLETLWVQLRYMARKENWEGTMERSGVKGGKEFGKRLKGRANDNMRPWNGNKEDCGFISLLIQSPLLPWPPLFLHLPFFCPLPPSFFQHPITASACCLSCGLHGWKWLETSNQWREKRGRG